MKPIYNQFLMMALAMGACCACNDDDSLIGGSDAAILTCAVATNGLAVDGGIMGNEIRVNLPLNSDLSQLDVDFTLSEGAKISPLPEQVTDWSQPVPFKVVSANGQYDRNYTVNVTVDTDKEFDTSVRIGNSTALQTFAENGYTILGGLSIFDDGTGDPISDLDALSGLRVVKTDLQIVSDGLVSVKMDSLKSVGNLDIISYSVEEVAFPSLENVSGRFRIGNDEAAPKPNYSLTTLSAGKLQSVGKSLVLHYNEVLSDINMSALKYVGGNVSFDGGDFANLNMMKNLTEVNGSLSIASTSLKNLDGFNVKRINGALMLAGAVLENLEGLSSLESCNFISLTGSIDSKLSSFKGMENVKVRDGISVNKLPEVTSTRYLPFNENMTYVDLQQLPNLADIEGFDKLTHLKSLTMIGLINIEDMHQLAVLSDLDDLMLQDMKLLQHLPEMKNLTKVNRRFLVSNLQGLKDMKGFSALKEVGDFYVDGLLEAESLEGLNELEKVSRGSFMVNGCPKIKDLAPLSNLKEVKMEMKDMIHFAANTSLEDYTAVKDLLLKYWPEGNRKFPKVKIYGNKYNPSYEQMLAGQCTPPAE